ncbi:MAG: VOC family protein [Acidobacteriota bacterium]
MKTLSKAVPLALAVFLLPLDLFAASAPKVAAVGFTVSDLDAEVAFFTGTLGFEKLSEHEVWGEPYEQFEGVFGLRERVARLKLGTEQVELTEYLTPRGRPIPVDAKSNDRWFQHLALVVSDMDAAYTKLRAAKVRHVSTGPQTLPDWNPNAGGIRAFYFQDPDGHNLEAIWYPAGKGNTRWQEHSSDKLFLGIDHTAIVVSDTDASLAFYRDLLGLTVAGASDNYGMEQEHLNQVFGAHLRITALKGSSGPGIEFLEYLTPQGGRPAPSDLAANDLAHWQTTLSVEEPKALDGLATRLREGHVPFVSPGIVTLPEAELAFHRGFQVLDPDGHAFEIVEP